MRTFKIAALSVATIAMLGASASIARPVPHKKHQVCKIERFHGHAKKVCHWVR